MASAQPPSNEFPHSLYDHFPTKTQCALSRCAFRATILTLIRTISLPFPTNRLASSALQTLDVDAELSPNVRRTLTLVAPSSQDSTEPQEKKQKQDTDDSKTVLKTTYYATTNRMLRVAVNGFMESLGVILGVMTELDLDVLNAEAEAKLKD
ncbi:hypothetical protein N7495_007935 [Penicillium taxi]|uniref:uncharacterized protein n=1 Tax=Penicillium taxi TaxID=168475 RepID=UPI0025451711|nr:uncharacterized protein N7495_007935 [Penicillium taxi]KAJ5887894.1 hypothetical protein N7495_007935 [Penicillium taxi]